MTQTLNLTVHVLCCTWLIYVKMQRIIVAIRDPPIDLFLLFWRLCCKIDARLVGLFSRKLLFDCVVIVELYLVDYL